MADSDNIAAQIKMNAELNKVLAARADALEKINKRLSDQAELCNQLANACTSGPNYNDALASLESLNNILPKTTKQVNDMNKSVDESAGSNKESRASIDAMILSLLSAQNASAGFTTNTRKAGQQVKSSTGLMGNFGKSLTQASKEIKKMSTGSFMLAGALEGFTQTLSTTRFAISGVFSIVTNLISGIYNLAKSIISFPFKVLGNLIDMAQSMGGSNEFARAREEVRDAFGDLSEGVANSIMQSERHMHGMMESGLRAFRIFGNRAEQLTFFLEVFKGLGPTAHIFAEEMKQNGTAVAQYAKGLGISNEQVRFVGLEAKAAGKSLTDVQKTMTIASTNMSQKFGIDQKSISSDIGAMMADTAHFTSLTIHEMSRASVYVRGLGLSIEEVAGILDKFDNFNDAAEAASNMAQAFGVSVDALEMMKEQSPDKRLDMMRKAFFATGQDAAKMTRQELKLLAANTGLSESATKLAFSMNNQGISMEELEKQQAKGEKKTMSQEEALTSLADSMKRLVKDGQALQGGFFSMFFQGFQRGIMRSAEFRGMLRDLRQALRVVFRAGREVGRMFVDMFPGVQKMITGFRQFFNASNFESLMSKVVEIFRTFFANLSDPNKAKDAVKNFLTAISDTFINFFGKGEGPFATLLSGAKDFAGAFGNIIAGAVRYAIELITPMLTKLTANFKKRKEFNDRYRENLAKQRKEAEATGPFTNLIKKPDSKETMESKALSETENQLGKQTGIFDDIFDAEGPANSFIGMISGYLSGLYEVVKEALMPLIELFRDPDVVGPFSKAFMDFLYGVGDYVLNEFNKNVWEPYGTQIMLGVAAWFLGPSLIKGAIWGFGQILGGWITGGMGSVLQRAGGAISRAVTGKGVASAAASAAAKNAERARFAAAYNKALLNPQLGAIDEVTSAAVKSAKTTSRAGKFVGGIKDQFKAVKTAAAKELGSVGASLRSAGGKVVGAVDDVGRGIVKAASGPITKVTGAFAKMGPTLAKVGAAGFKVVPIAGWIAGLGMGVSEGLDKFYDVIDEKFNEGDRRVGAAAAGILQSLTLGLLPDSWAQQIANSVTQLQDVFFGLIDSVFGEDLSKSMREQFGYAIDMLDAIGDLIFGIFSGDSDAIGTSIEQFIFALIPSFINSLKLAFIDLPLSIVQGIMYVLSGIAGAVMNIITGLLKGIRNIIGGVLERLFGKEVRDKFNAFVQPLFDFIEMIKNVITGIPKLLGDLFGGIRSSISAVWDFLTGKIDLSAMGSKILEALNSVKDSFLSIIPTRLREWLFGAEAPAEPSNGPGRPRSAFIEKALAAAAEAGEGSPAPDAVKYMSPEQQKVYLDTVAKKMMSPIIDAAQATGLGKLYHSVGGVSGLMEAMAKGRALEEAEKLKTRGLSVEDMTLYENVKELDPATVEATISKFRDQIVPLFVGPNGLMEAIRTLSSSITKEDEIAIGNFSLMSGTATVLANFARDIAAIATNAAAIDPTQITGAETNIKSGLSAVGSLMKAITTNQDLNYDKTELEKLPGVKFFEDIFNTFTKLGQLGSKIYSLRGATWMKIDYSDPSAVAKLPIVKGITRLSALAAAINDVVSGNVATMMPGEENMSSMSSIPSKFKIDQIPGIDYFMSIGTAFDEISKLNAKAVEGAAAGITGIAIDSPVYKAATFMKSLSGELTALFSTSGTDKFPSEKAEGILPTKGFFGGISDTIGQISTLDTTLAASIIPTDEKATIEKLPMIVGIKKMVAVVNSINRELTNINDTSPINVKLKALAEGLGIKGEKFTIKDKGRVAVHVNLKVIMKTEDVAKSLVEAGQVVAGPSYEVAE